MVAFTHIQGTNDTAFFVLNGLASARDGDDPLPRCCDIQPRGRAPPEKKSKEEKDDYETEDHFALWIGDRRRTPV
jgi:hypothetical protein